MSNNEGSWVTVQPSIEPLLTPLQPVVTLLNSVLEVLVNTLNVTSAILEVVKTFATGLLNPLRALTEELIKLVQDFLADLRSIGLYLYIGDAALTKSNFTALLGGYAAFENRLLRALLDGNDATRPQPTAGKVIFGAVFYLSVDLSSVFLILRLRRSLQQLFGFKLDNTPPFPSPIGLSVTYGNPDLGMASFAGVARRLSLSGQLQAAALRWNIPEPMQYTPNPMPPPGGFIVEVCTVSGGLGVYADATVTDASGVIVGRKKIGIIDPMTSESVVAYGGTDTVSADSVSFFPFTSSSNSPQVYLVTNQNSPAIPLRSLQDLEKSTGKRYFGRSFFIKTPNIRALPPGQGFGMVLRREDLPYTGDVELLPSTDPARDLYGELRITDPYQPSEFFVVVRAVDPERAREIMASQGRKGLGTSGNPARYNYPLYDYIKVADVAAAATASNEFEATIGTGRGQFGPSSDFVGINFPSNDRVVTAIQTALLIAILSRSDLPFVVPTGTGTGPPGVARLPTNLESIVKTELKSLSLDNQFFARFRNNPQAFAKTLLNRVEGLANLILRNALLSIQPNIVLGAANPMLEFRWSTVSGNLPDLTILESVKQTALGNGLHINPIAKSPPPLREPYFYDSSTPKRRANTDNSPIVIGSGSGNDVFCRNALASVYADAQSVLSLITDTRPNLVGPYTKSPNWVAIRFMPNSVPALDRLLANTEAFASAFLDGLEDVSNALIGYIEFIQTRIRNLQAIIDQIRSIIEYILEINIPAVSGLLLTARGTGGLIRGITGASNKPSDSSLSYGFGFAVVGVGLPVVIMDLLGAILTTPSDSP